MKRLLFRRRPHRRKRADEYQSYCYRGRRGRGYIFWRNVVIALCLLVLGLFLLGMLHS